MVDFTKLAPVGQNSFNSNKTVGTKLFQWKDNKIIKEAQTLYYGIWKTKINRYLKVDRNNLIKWSSYITV